MTTHCFIHLLQPSLVWRLLEHLTHEVESNPIKLLGARDG